MFFLASGHNWIDNLPALCSANILCWNKRVSGKCQQQRSSLLQISQLYVNGRQTQGQLRGLSTWFEFHFRFITLQFPVLSSLYLYPFRWRGCGANIKELIFLLVRHRNWHLDMLNKAETNFKTKSRLLQPQELTAAEWINYANHTESIRTQH